MDEFRVRVLGPDWMEVEQPSTGYAWSFSIDKQADGKRLLSGPTGMAWGGRWPDGNLTQAADDFARDEAVRVDRADG